MRYYQSRHYELAIHQVVGIVITRTQALMWMSGKKLELVDTTYGELN
jgi:hypothetical protein